MTDMNWKPEELEIDLVNQDELEEMELDVVEGGLELPPDLADESIDADQLDHLGNAATAQAAADQAVEAGDYESAQILRETAEQELDAAGLDETLDGPNSIELEAAADHQERADELEADQAISAQEGDYESALELSRDAVLETQASDELAGGSDHSGQNQLDAGNMEWAEFHKDLAQDHVESAIEFAESGNTGAAENALSSAADEQNLADHYGDLGEHGGAIADFDPASAIETNPVDSYSPADIDVADTSVTDFSIDTTTDTSTTDTSSTDDFST